MSAPHVQHFELEANRLFTSLIAEQASSLNFFQKRKKNSSLNQHEPRTL